MDSTLSQSIATYGNAIAYKEKPNKAGMAKVWSLSYHEILTTHLHYKHASLTVVLCH